MPGAFTTPVRTSTTATITTTIKPRQPAPPQPSAIFAFLFIVSSFMQNGFGYTNLVCDVPDRLRPAATVWVKPSEPSSRRFKTADDTACLVLFLHQATHGPPRPL